MFFFLNQILIDAPFLPYHIYNFTSRYILNRINIEIENFISEFRFISRFELNEEISKSFSSHQNKCENPSQMITNEKKRDQATTTTTTKICLCLRYFDF